MLANLWLRRNPRNFFLQISRNHDNHSLIHRAKHVVHDSRRHIDLARYINYHFHYDNNPNTNLTPNITFRSYHHIANKEQRLVQLDFQR